MQWADIEFKLGSDRALAIKARCTPELTLGMETQSGLTEKDDLRLFEQNLTAYFAFFFFFTCFAFPKILSF